MVEGCQCLGLHGLNVGSRRFKWPGRVTNGPAKFFRPGLARVAKAGDDSPCGFAGGWVIVSIEGACETLEPG